MATPSVVLNSSTHNNNITLNEQKDLQQQHQPSSSTNACVKAVPEDLTNGFPSLPRQIPPENEPDGGAELTKSVNELSNLAIAIQTFKNRYDELQKHLDFIEQAIDARSKELTASLPSASGTVPNSQVDAAAAAGDGDLVVVQPVTENDGKSSDSNNNPKPKAEGSENEIVSLCRTMNSRGLRKYIVSHLLNAAELREQVPTALKSAPKPAKLVFDCIGRFFLQGSKAYTKNSPMIPARQASVLVLEYYLMSGCVESEKEVDSLLKNEAGLAAVAWRKRLIVEGGVAKACEIDARGLVLFIAGFGIPNVFRNEDVSNLIRLSNPREISHALRQSQVLLKRVSDIAEGMMKKGTVVEAVDLAYIFGFEEKLSPQTTLASFLQKSEEAWKKTKQESHDFPSVLKEANEKYLAALKSVVNCLEGHKIDFEKLLPGWQLKDKIINLEKDIGDANKKIGEKLVSKRKVDKNNSLNKVKIPEAKRSRFTVKDPSVASPSVTAMQEQRTTSHIERNSSYDVSMTSHLLDGRSYGYSNYYPTASSIQIGSVSGSLTESFLGGTVASVGNMLGGAIAGPAMSAGIGAPSSSYSGYQGDTILDNVGTMQNSNSHLYRWHGIGEGTLSDERSIGQGFAGQTASARVSNLYGRTSTDGFAGLPDHPSIGVASRSGGSDLYSFADAVFDV